MSQDNPNKPFTLAKPWILPFIIIAGLAAAWATPWSFGDSSYFQISKIIVPLVIQSALSAVTAILAFLGKPAWLGLLIATFSLALVNGIGFTLGIWGAKLPTTQNIVLIITALTLIPTFIFGRKQVNYQIPTDVPTWNTENPHSDW